MMRQVLRRSFSQFTRSAQTLRSSEPAANTSRALGTFPKQNTIEHGEEELKYMAYIYKPVPVVFSEGKGAVVTDINGDKYLDFLAAYSAVNQGHCHPKIVDALIKQSQKLTLSSRAFYNDMLLPFCKLLDETFGYEKAITMNTGVEGGETALKISRRWAYRAKKVPKNECITIVARNNFWGRTMSAISSSTDPDCYTDFGPFMPGYEFVNYDDLDDLRAKFEKFGDRVGAFMVEPIQGEAGVYVPKEGYLKGVRALCDEFNVLFVADEVQTGLGRTGKMLAVEHEQVKPDILILGKALSGGTYPVSAILTSSEIMQYLTPNSHGSTYGGNALACAVGIASIEVLLEEKLAERSERLGQHFRKELSTLVDEVEAVKIVRGKGLMNAIVIESEKATAWDLCLKLAENGILAKPTHGNIIRFTPPLVIEEEQLQEGIDKIRTCTKELFA